MKRAAFLIAVLLAILAPASPAPEDYSIKVHVTGTYIVAAHDWRQLELDAVIDGKKFRLRDNDNDYLLAPGDYKAALIEDKHDTAYESLRRYEFLFPDRKTRKFWVVGQNE
jgi:hypothetical protein